MNYSKQNQVVKMVVDNSCDHPTAEMVSARCKEIMPSINLATVYRNLNMLVREGKVRRVSVAGGDRFDKTLTNHSHLKCTKCSGVFDACDFDNEILNRAKIALNGEIESVEIIFTGVCQNCNKNS